MTFKAKVGIGKMRVKCVFDPVLDRRMIPTQARMTPVGHSWFSNEFGLKGLCKKIQAVGVGMEWTLVVGDDEHERVVFHAQI